MSVPVAIIDSGINPFHPHVHGVSGVISFRMDETADIIENPDFSDHIGHGTAIAGVIREKAPDADMYAVKIFYDKLKAPVDLLIAGLKWAIDENMKIIHLSLGTEQDACKARLGQLCREAYRKHIIMVAAARSPEDDIFPAGLPGVIGVYWNRQCRKGEIICHPGCRIEFGASGRPRKLTGIPENMNFSGHSFAAAQVTGKIAALLEGNPQAEPEWLRELLAQQAVNPES
jgi:subtilisin family serine protease